MNNNKFFSVNMNTTEEPKPENVNNNNSSNNSNTNTSSAANKTYMSQNPRKGIVFNQDDLEKKYSNTTTVRKIEDADELFGTKKEKFTGKDLKLVLVPGIILIILCVLNEIFGIPFIIDKTVTYVLKDNLNVKMTIGSMNNDELTAIAGLIAVSSYCIFSIALFAFSIYNLFKRVYVKRDLYEIGGKILLYAFLIGFLIAVSDSLLSFNLTKIIIKITTIGLHSM
ncbi:MAG: hypothetical protein IKX00_00800 [Bacilli bacterium]|nr:hypothetical protein [Bacilli bacterium]